MIEGPDRTGKNSLIAEILSYCQNSLVTHFGKPVGKTNEEKKDFQMRSFIREFKNVEDFSRRCKKQDIWNERVNCAIWNRSHIGEFIYGKLYRDTNPDEWVPGIEDDYCNNDDEKFLVLLTASPEFLSKKDDGDSFSANIEDIEKEISLFRDAVKNSIIRNKIEICVEENGEFRPKQDVINDVLNFITI